MAKTWKKENRFKIEDEIKMVYDASNSGLNDSVFDPQLSMYTIDSHLRSVKAETFMTEIDVGEMFLNFMFEPEAQLYAEVDLNQVFSKEGLIKGGRLNDYWTRMLMVLSPSTYFVTKYMLIVEKLVRRDRLGADNVFRW